VAGCRRMADAIIRQKTTPSSPSSFPKSAVQHPSSTLAIGNPGYASSSRMGTHEMARRYRIKPLCEATLSYRARAAEFVWWASQ